jgi:hypothetical protein
MKKELQVGQSHSLIPLLAIELGSVQVALDVAFTNAAGLYQIDRRCCG